MDIFHVLTFAVCRLWKNKSICEQLENITQGEKEMLVGHVKGNVCETNNNYFKSEQTQTREEIMTNNIFNIRLYFMIINSAATTLQLL